MQPQTEQGHCPRMARMSQGVVGRPGNSSHLGASQAVLPFFSPSPPTCHLFWQTWIISEYCLVADVDRAQRLPVFDAPTMTRG